MFQKRFGEEKYYSSDTLVNKTSVYNELDFLRQQNGVKKQPDYILVFKRNGIIQNLEEANKAQQDWKGKLPIIVIDVDRCLESEKLKIEQLIDEYEENPDIEIEKQIIQKIDNNQKTCSNFSINQDWGIKIQEFIGRNEKIDNENRKKKLYISTKERVKRIYHKVKQKAVQLVGLITAKEAYETTTAAERIEETSKFKQILSQVQMISKGEDENEQYQK